MQKYGIGTLHISPLIDTIYVSPGMPQTPSLYVKDQLANAIYQCMTDKEPLPCN